MASRQYEDAAYHASVVGLDPSATMEQIDAVVQNPTHLFLDLQNETNLQRANMASQRYPFRQQGTAFCKVTMARLLRDSISSIEGNNRFQAHDYSRGSLAPSPMSVRSSDTGYFSAVSHQQADNTHHSPHFAAHDHARAPLSMSPSPTTAYSAKSGPKAETRRQVTETGSGQTPSKVRKTVSSKRRSNTQPGGLRRATYQNRYKLNDDGGARTAIVTGDGWEVGEAEHDLVCQCRPYIEAGEVVPDDEESDDDESDHESDSD